MGTATAEVIAPADTEPMGFENVEFSTVITGIIDQTIKDLAAKVVAEDRVAYNSATVELHADLDKGTITASILTVPKQ